MSPLNRVTDYAGKHKLRRHLNVTMLYSFLPRNISHVKFLLASLALRVGDR
jgi:hypothetical protein